MRTREELEIDKDNRFLVKEWQAEAALARAAGRISEFNELLSSNTMQFYKSLRPQGTVNEFDNEFDDFNSSEIEELEEAMAE